MMLHLRTSCAVTTSRVPTRHLMVSSVLQRSKENRQATYVRELLELGVNYSGSLSHAKSTLNRFLLNDAKIFGLTDLGNGNNRNLKDRLFPELFKLCDKFKVSKFGTYTELRNRLKDKKPFDGAMSWDDWRNVPQMKIIRQTQTPQSTTEKKKKEKGKAKVKEPKVAKASE
eukprot:TRINITY_DN16365_c0_g1_i1.p1 TRINITY_DN16365_c0_g1~~TRINITY_DN16365_c0_g1_i1.p1  ORF type:complete len:171 (-),score=38.21 TRINITY_DN16365_c0_g1_i1:101-613(-)